MADHSLKNKKVLVTCGPTWVPIDDVRVISNKSTGRLGQTVALDLARAGAKVTLIEGPVDDPLISKAIRILKFSFYSELRRLLQKELRYAYHAVIHAAAVSDYRLRRSVSGKLSSSLRQVRIELVPTQKIIRMVKKTNPAVFLVGFKLEAGMSRASASEKSKDLFKQAKCDLVVANSTSEQQYDGYIVDPDCVLASGGTRKEISKNLVRILKDRL